jgi:putative transposase
VLACDFFETVTVTGVHLFVLAVIEHARRRIRVLGATAHPTASWVVQAARNLVMDLEDAGSQARFLIRDRDGKFPGLFDTVLKDAGTEVVLSGVQMPRMNAIMERWLQTCRRELPDRTLIWNQAHLLHALRESGQFYNSRRPHQGIANARPLRALPSPIPGLDATTRLHVHRHDHLGGILHEYRHAALPARMRSSASTHRQTPQPAAEGRWLLPSSWWKFPVSINPYPSHAVSYITLRIRRSSRPVEKYPRYACLWRPRRSSWHTRRTDRSGAS